MKHIGWRGRLFKSTRGKILELLRARECTVNDLAGALRLTDNAVRAHLASLERDRTRQQRIDVALGILKELGGSASFKEEDGKHFIYGNGCPIAAATTDHPEACLLAESLLTELIGSPVQEQCIRGPTPSCRFEVTSRLRSGAG